MRRWVSWFRNKKQLPPVPKQSHASYLPKRSENIRVTRKIPTKEGTWRFIHQFSKLGTTQTPIHRSKDEQIIVPKQWNRTQHKKEQTTNTCSHVDNLTPQIMHTYIHRYTHMYTYKWNGVCTCEPPSCKRVGIGMVGNNVGELSRIITFLLHKDLGCIWNLCQASSN